MHDLIGRLWTTIIDLIANGVRPATIRLLIRMNLIFGLVALAGAFAYRQGSRSPVSQALVAFLALLVSLSIPIRRLPSEPTIRAWTFLGLGVLLLVLPSMAAFVLVPRRDTQRNIVTWSYRVIVAFLIINIFIR